MLPLVPSVLAISRLGLVLFLRFARDLPSRSLSLEKRRSRHGAAISWISGSVATRTEISLYRRRVALRFCASLAGNKQSFAVATGGGPSPSPITGITSSRAAIRKDNCSPKLSRMAEGAPFVSRALLLLLSAPSLVPDDEEEEDFDAEKAEIGRDSDGSHGERSISFSCGC